MLEKQFMMERKFMKEMKKVTDEVIESQKEIAEIVKEEELADQAEIEAFEKIDLEQKLSEMEDYSTKLEINNIQVYIEMISKELDKFESTPLIQKRMKQQIQMLKNIFSLERLMTVKPIGNFNLKNVKSQARNKLSKNKKFTFIDPSSITSSLKEVFEDNKFVNKIVLHVCNYINLTKIDNEGTYIHFLLLMLYSLNNKEMKDREVVIENIKKLF